MIFTLEYIVVKLGTQSWKSGYKRVDPVSDIVAAGRVDGSAELFAVVVDTDVETDVDTDVEIDVDTEVWVAVDTDVDVTVLVDVTVVLPPPNDTAA